MKIIIPLQPYAKKNGQKIIINRLTKRPMIIQGEKYLKYERDCSKFLNKYKTNIDYPVNVKSVFYMADNRRRDLTNYEEALADILVKYGVIKDDNFKIVQSWDGSRIKIDKDNPRTEIEITKMEEI